MHDPAQAESMREMLKKMSQSPEQKPSFQFTSPKPPAQAAPDTAERVDRSTARRGARVRSTPTPDGEVERQLFGEASSSSLQRKRSWARRPRTLREDKRHNACRRDPPSPKPSKSFPAAPFHVGASTKPRAGHFGLSRPWTRTCLPVHLILVHLLRPRNHQDGDARSGHQSRQTLPSCSKRRRVQNRLRWRPRRRRASSSSWGLPRRRRRRTGGRNTNEG